VCCDAYDDEAAAQHAAGRWPNLLHFHAPARTLRLLNVDRVPSRMIVRGDGTIAKFWDGSHGNVLKGAHGASLRNGSHDFIGQLVQYMPDE